MVTALAQTVIDNFNDNSFNTSLWATPAGATGIAETSLKLRISALAAYPEARSTANQSVALGILGVQMDHTGTTTASTETYVGISDSGGNQILVQADTSGTGGWSLHVNGAVTVGTTTKLVSTLWSGWAANTWLGIGNIGSDNVVHIYKSTDGVTWTEMGSATVGGTFNKAAVGMSLCTGVFSSTSTWITLFDNVSYFSFSLPVLGKIRVGGVWVTPSALKVRSGGAWVTPTAVKVRASGVWGNPT